MNRSIFSRALVASFSSLHPALQERYRFGSEDGVYSSGEGLMDGVWSGSRLFTPFLWVGSRRNIMFPGKAENVPFRIECWAYRDSFGRETLSLNRFFMMNPVRRFDEYVVEVADSPPPVIYVGTHQHLAVKLELSCADGALRIRSSRQRLLLPGFAFRFPLSLSATADIFERYDEESEEIRIDGRVRNGMLGDVFCCSGSYRSRVLPVPAGGIPGHVRPVQEESRW